MKTEEEINSPSEYEYNYNDYVKKEVKEEKPRGNKYVIISLILIIILGVLVFLLIKGCDNGENNIPKNEIVLSLDFSTIELKIGETKRLSAKVLNSDDKNIVINWNSSDSTIANINDDGVITGLKVGTVTITAIYFDDDNNSYEAKCEVQVLDNGGGSVVVDPVDKEKPVINYTITGGSDNVWTKNDVSIKVNAKDNTGIKELKYALNCVKNCKYTTLKNGSSISVKTAGTTVVTIVASDKNNNTATKTLTIKIDKTNPVVTLDITGPKVYNNTGSVTVCATCKDNESGCTKEKVCQDYTKSSTGNTIEVSDKTGNKAKSYPFNIIIDKNKPTCSLEVAESGLLTATVADTGGSEILYKGFDSKYTGASATTKQLTASATVTYYVKDNAGNTNTCDISVNKVTQYRKRTCSKNTFGDWKYAQKYTGECEEACPTPTPTKSEAEAKGYMNYYTQPDIVGDAQCSAWGYDLGICYIYHRYNRPLTGCTSWGSWSGWGTTSIKSYTYQIDVQTRAIYEKK